MRQTRHAEPMAAMALDMKEAVKKLKDPSNNNALTVTIGPCKIRTKIHLTVAK